MAWRTCYKSCLAVCINYNQATVTVLRYECVARLITDPELQEVSKRYIIHMLYVNIA